MLIPIAAAYHMLNQDEKDFDFADFIDIVEYLLPKLEEAKSIVMENNFKLNVNSAAEGVDDTTHTYSNIKAQVCGQVAPIIRTLVEDYLGLSQEVRAELKDLLRQLKNAESVIQFKTGGYELKLFGEGNQSEYPAQLLDDLAMGEGVVQKKMIIIAQTFTEENLALPEYMMSEETFSELIEKHEDADGMMEELLLMSRQEIERV